MVHVSSFLLMASLILPFSVLAKVKNKDTALLLAVGESPVPMVDQNQFLKSLQNKLKHRARFLPIRSVSQLARTTEASSHSPELDEAIHMMNDSLDAYASYSRNAKQTIVAMDSLKNFVSTKVTPSPQTSELLVSAIMTKTWLLHKSRQKEKAQKELHQLLSVAPQVHLQTQNYPPSFRRFVKRQITTVNPGSHKAFIRSSPAAADVFVNNVFVGVSPLTVNLPQGEYTVGFYASGRKPSQKKLNLTKSKSKKIHAHLAWAADGKKSKPLQADHWNQLKPSKKIRLAHQVASAAQANHALFFSFEKQNGFPIAKATVYDARFSQMMKVITYPKPIANFKNEQAALIQFYSKKLTPYFGKNSMSYWSKNVDQSLILDHRMARHGKKPLHKQPAFWAIGLGVIAAGVITAVVLSQGSDSSSPSTGGVTVGLGGLK